MIFDLDFYFHFYFLDKRHSWRYHFSLFIYSLSLSLLLLLVVLKRLFPSYDDDYEFSLVLRYMKEFRMASPYCVKRVGLYEKSIFCVKRRST